MLDGKVSDRRTRRATLTAGLAVGACVLSLAGCGVQLPGTTSDGLSGANNGPVQLKGITPDSGPIGEETIVLLTGEGFVQGMTVHFGDQIAEQVQVIDETRATAVVPSENAGVFDVTVQSSLGVATIDDGYVNFLLPPEDGTDTDGDGLTDHQEHVGWAVRVDQLGWGLDPGLVGNELLTEFDGSNLSVLVVYTARSDINLVDTDGDGLTDGEEFIIKSDPRTRDTDTDGLWDGEEWFRWLTSPVSVDTDGDARSADPSSAFASLPPNASLFDGAELYEISELLKAPDERGPIKFNATSPTLDDTDGDNVRDTVEIDTPVRTPLLADMPQLIFEIVDDIDIRLDIEYAEEEGVSTAYESSFTTVESRSVTQSQSNTVSGSVTVGAELGFGPLDFGGASVEVTAGYEHSWGTDVESSVSSEATFTQIEEKSRTNTETAATGSMTTGIRVTNIGNISVQVIDLGFTVRQWEPNTDTELTGVGEYRTFAELVPDISEGLTLAPGANSGVIPAVAEDINADRVKSFLARPDDLQIEPAAFELVNDAGINFAFLEEITQARTARVSIDFGDGNFEEYRVATNVDRNSDGTLAGITMDKVMDLTVGPGNWETQVVVDPCTLPFDVITNGGFELPEVIAGDGVGPIPDGWQIRYVDLPNSDAVVGVIHEDDNLAGLDSPEGDQWLFAGLDSIAFPEVSDTGLYQEIGVVTDGTTYDFSFWITPRGAVEFDGSNVHIFLWGVAAGNQLIDEEVFFINGTKDGLEQKTGSLNTGSDNTGQPLFIEIFFERGPLPDDERYLIDDFQLTTGDPADQQEVLFRVRDVDSDVAAPRFWSVFLAGENTAGGLPFADTVLRNGDSVLIALTKDEDGDGIYAAQEQQYGSSDLTADSDGDGLTDPEEAAREYLDQGTCQTLEGGWIVQVTLRDGSMIDFRVYSDPRRADSDGDGVDDLQEKIDGTNPNSRDTDQDGLTDDVDPRPTIQAAILYVLKGNPSGEGTSWGTAFGELSEGMDAAIARNSDGDETNDISEIWVSSGGYDLSEQALPNATKIYGGFAGGETRLAQRTANGVVNGTFINQGTPGLPMITTPSSVTVRLDGFAFQGADTTAVLLDSSNSDVEIANCFFFENTGASDLQLSLQGGGAIAVNGLGVITLTLEDCVFVGNRATGPQAREVVGGAVAVVFSTLNIRRCTFIGNTAEAPDSGDGASGGAVYVIGASTSIIEDSRFSDNVVLENASQSDDPLHGGAIVLEGVLNATIQNCTFEDNEVDDAGVTLLNFLTIAVAWDSVRAGGGVAVFGSTKVDILNSVFVGNRAPMFGGGLYVGPGTTKAGVTNCTFHGNEAYPNLLEGGSPEDVVYVMPCDSPGVLLSFTPIGVGGGIGAEGTVITDNSVFWDNIGVDMLSVKLFGLPIVLDEPVSMEQQIATPPVGLPENFGPCVTSAGTISYNHCAVKDNDLTYFTMNLLEGIANINPLDPLFVNAPGRNFHLASGSPLIDAGSQFIDASAVLPGFQVLPELDFDGNFRITDGTGNGIEEVDMGAFEFQSGE